MRNPCRPTNREKRTWKVIVSSFTGRLVAASPKAHPRPNITARAIAIVKCFFVASSLLVLSVVLVIVPFACLQTDVMMMMNIVQLKT